MLIPYVTTHLKHPVFCHYFVITCHLWPSYYVRKHNNAFAAPLLSEYLSDTLNEFPEIEPTQFKQTRDLEMVGQEQ